jgi:hypothetical protein
VECDAIEWAYLAKEIPPHAKVKVVRRGNRAKGVAYERKVQKFLADELGFQYLPSPWIRYKLLSGSIHWAQPDGIYFDLFRGLYTIVEIKLSHTPDAYEQIWNLYHPLLASIFPSDIWVVRGLEVVKWYDPHTHFPGKHRLRKEINEVKFDETGVLIWNPRK